MNELIKKIKSMKPSDHIQNMVDGLRKPSTKEAYEAQNSKKEIKEWSVGTYVVFLKRFGCSELGDIDEIIREESRDSSLKCRKEGIITMDSNYTKWFATYEEANIFSKELKTPLSKAFNNLENDLFQIGNYAVCINSNANHTKGRVTEINYIINKNEFAGDNLKSNYKQDFKAFESIREANAFSNSFLKESNLYVEELSDRFYSIKINPTITSSPLTPEECYPVKEAIKTQVISTNVIDIQLKSKKKNNYLQFKFKNKKQ